jgi:hypothetical protein
MIYGVIYYTRMRRLDICVVAHRCRRPIAQITDVRCRFDVDINGIVSIEVIGCWSHDSQAQVSAYMNWNVQPKFVEISSPQTELTLGLWM